MPRTAMSIVLIAATLIGPCLCCCAWATFIQPTVEPTTVAQHTPANTEEFTCPLCRPSVPPKPAEPQPLQPIPSERHCPCCDDRAQAAMVAEVPQPLDVIQLAVVAILPTLSESTVSLNAVRAAGPEINPSGIGQDCFLIDYCHHRLRC